MAAQFHFNVAQVLMDFKAIPTTRDTAGLRTCYSSLQDIPFFDLLALTEQVLSMGNAAGATAGSRMIHDQLQADIIKIRNRLKMLSAGSTGSHGPA